MKRITITILAGALLGGPILGGTAWAQDGDMQGKKPAINAAKKFGAGVGLIAGAQDLLTIDSQVALRYWLSDSVAVTGQFVMLGFIPGDSTGRDAGLRFAPAAVITGALLKGRTTRLNVGAGFGMSLRLNDPGGQRGPVGDADLALAVPLRAGVEHFFAEWISIEIATQTNFIQFDYFGSDFQEFRFGFDTTTFGALLFFYID